MVATRNHPRDFPPPVESPTKLTKRTTRSAEPTSTTPSKSPTSSKPAVETTTITPSSSSADSKPSSKSSITTSPAARTRPMSYTSSLKSPRDAPRWSHTPPPIAFPWLALSLPLVVWDTIYIMGRPHTFAGGAIAWPLYVPYELYGRVDPVYSIEAYYSGLGWTGAQGLGNVFETLAYVAYAYIVVAYGRDEGRAEGILGSLGAVGRRRRVDGFWGAVASLVGYTTFMVTVAKSVLYWYNDAFMGFPIFKLNSWFNFIFVFAIPKYGLVYQDILTRSHQANGSDLAVSRGYSSPPTSATYS
ncbi:hypothetical protein MBLNU13_g03613t1 [Cladosporium sp. NU13]